MLTKFLLLLPFLAIYGAAHWLLIRRFMIAGFTRPAILAPVGIWSFLMIFGPPFVVNVEGFSPETLAAIASVVYTWLAFMFLFLFWSHLLRLTRRLAETLGRGSRDSAWRLISHRAEFLIHLGLVIGMVLYGFWEAANPRLVQLEIADPRIPPETRFRVAFICDLHLSYFDNTPRVRRTLDLLETARPDLLLAGGDLTDVQMHDAASMSALFASLSTPSGRFAVIGNHEVYAGLDAALKFHADAGFRMLRGEAVDVAPFLTVAGFDDPTVRARTFPVPTDLPASDAVVLAGIDHKRFTIVVRHQPSIASGTTDLFDLQLSGHTHGGQIWPWIWMTRLKYAYWPGLTAIGSRSRLYVSRGSATIGPQIRIFAPPEVTIIDLVHGSRPSD